MPLQERLTWAWLVIVTMHLVLASSRIPHADLLGLPGLLRWPAAKNDVRLRDSTDMQTVRIMRIRKIMQARIAYLRFSPAHLPEPADSGF
jgi:hypothetical protein